MFIYTVRASTLKFFCVIALSVAVLCAVILTIPEYTPVSTKAVAAESTKYSYDKIKTSDDIVSFLSQFGWEVDGTPLEEVKIRIPMEFDKVMNSYNEIQKNQGLDLSKYKGKEVVRYTYEITNYPDYGGTVYANVIIHKNRVVGGDVCSADVTGFISGFAMPEGKSSGK